MVEKAKEQRDKMRELASEGAILVLCEENASKILVDGFKYAAHTILERKGNDEFLIIKSRVYDYNANTVHRNFMKRIDDMYAQFIHVMIVEDRNNITTIKTPDLAPEKGLSKWYFEKRGHFMGKKFGI